MAKWRAGEAGGGKGRLGEVCRVTMGFLSISKHKANTTELHPKVRQTCFLCKLRTNQSCLPHISQHYWRHSLYQLLLLELELTLAYFLD